MIDFSLIPRTQVGPTQDRTAGEILADPDCYATVILAWCLDEWGTLCLHDPEDPDRGPWAQGTFEHAIEERLGVDIPKKNIAKLMAAIAVLTTDVFFRNLKAFIPMANIFAGEDTLPGVFDPADAIECGWAITEAVLLDPPETNEVFCDEIRHYVSKVLLDEGYIKPPDVLRIAIDADFTSKVSFDYGDDPEMFAAIYQRQREKVEEFDTIIHERLTELFSQLKALPLVHGDPKALGAQIEQMLERTRPAQTDSILPATTL